MKQLNLPELEQQIQKYWDDAGTFRRICEMRKPGKKYYFCQGPPFTTGHAHIGHAWNHTIKDLIIRYKTMQGFDVFRRAGWDMHGLPIEVKVEQDVLKSKNKREIEEYGIDNFIRECKKFAIRNMHAMTGQIKRLGIWLDWDDPYMTIDRRYMEGVWFGIKRAYEQDLLYSDKRVIHWCPRCETAMAGYEVRDEYRDVTDPSVFVKAKILSDNELNNEFILIWTTTPWTLPANAAIAVHPDYDYVKIKLGDEILILAEGLLGVIEKTGREYKILNKFKGIELEGLRYEPMLNIPIQQGFSHRIVLAPELVTLEDGTGCVHIAPGHGVEDEAVGAKNNLQKLSPVNPSGKFTTEPYMEIYVRDANKIIINDLKNSGNLLAEETVFHRYPHCWRCKTPLILRTTNQWFLAVSKIKDKLIVKNREISWVPDWIGSGGDSRFENWLKNAEDWCISRQRYWNTPLPVWKCECGNMEVIGTIDELIEKAVQDIDPEILDLHRPAIDKITLKCSCSREMHRVKDVMDVWLDSGSASWANLGYPHKKEIFNKLFPADFITEGSDQTRGWFYSMLVSSVISFDSIAYKQVLYHGFTLDSEGRKMSKSLGNVIDPLDMVEKYGADAFRFYLLFATVPWEDLRFSEEGMQSVGKMLNILWNTYSFAKNYMEIDNYKFNKDDCGELEIADRWILSKFNSLIIDATFGMEKVYPHEAVRPINDFVLNLSRWYIKLVRDRVWIESSDPRKISVYYTLHTILTGLSVIMAPVTPHLSEHVYRDLTGEESVHFKKWLTADEKLIDKKLEDRFSTAQKIIECVLAARQEADIKLRWPIRKVTVTPKEPLEIDPVKNLILKMSNAKELVIEDVEVTLVVKPNFASMGPKFRGDAGKIVKKLGELDAAEIKNAIDENNEYKLKIEGNEFILNPDDLFFETKLPENIIAEEFDGGMVYIDKTLDDKLYSEAMAREVIRRIQDMRKEMDLNEVAVVDVLIDTNEGFDLYVKENLEYIEKETRSKIGFGKGEGFGKVWKIEGSEVRVVVKE
ncbi:isoleucine--tRNA ligase [Candidatus Altiarchaeales archaeon WOR_SM1_SCG]|nr:isoleucine--tRNA ligase [Candidatus Altiarchaeales archaeon WOR_SM1_SCG]